VKIFALRICCDGCNIVCGGYRSFLESKICSRLLHAFK
jgi:hypothetical protein